MVVDEDNLYDVDELSRSIPVANATTLDPTNICNSTHLHA
jgi:hypothetical protein